MSLARSEHRRLQGTGHHHASDVVVEVDLEKGGHEESKMSAAHDSPSTSGAPSQSRVLKTGTMYKKGGVTGAMYNPRLFELRSNGELNYYITDIMGKRIKKGGIAITATTKIEKRSGSTKRDAKFIIHHPLEDKEWYLWCHRPKLPQPVIDFKPGSDKNPFVNLANTLKIDKAPKQKKKKEAVSGNHSKQKPNGKGPNGFIANGNGKKGNAMWPFQYLSNLNPNLNKGHSPPPTTDCWTGKAGRKMDRGDVTVLKDSEDSDEHDDDQKEESRGQQEAEEWCNLLNEMILKCKKKHVNCKGQN